METHRIGDPGMPLFIGPADSVKGLKTTVDTAFTDVHTYARVMASKG